MISSQTDLDAYLAGGGKDAATIKAYGKAIALEAAAAATAGFDMSHTKPSAEPTVSTQKFISDQDADDFHRLQEHAAAEIRAQKPFNREEHDAERSKAARSLQLGGEGQTYINGMKP